MLHHWAATATLRDRTSGCLSIFEEILEEGAEIQSLTISRMRWTICLRGMLMGKFSMTLKLLHDLEKEVFVMLRLITIEKFKNLCDLQLATNY